MLRRSLCYVIVKPYDCSNLFFICSCKRWCDNLIIYSAISIRRFASFPNSSTTVIKCFPGFGKIAIS